MRNYIMIAALAIAAPVTAEECKPDIAEASEHFKEAYTELIEYQSYAHVCAEAIGKSHAQAGVMGIQGLFMRSGFTHSEAVIRAEETDQTAKKRAAKYGPDIMPSGPAARSIDVANDCLETLNEIHRRYEVANARMMKAQCQP